MSAKTLRSGALSVTVQLDGKILRSVKLPRAIPDDLDAAALAGLIAQLREYDIDLTEAPPFQRRAWEKLRRIESLDDLETDPAGVREPRVLEEVQQHLA